MHTLGPSNSQQIFNSAKLSQVLNTSSSCNSVLSKIPITSHTLEISKSSEVSNSSKSDSSHSSDILVSTSSSDTQDIFDSSELSKIIDSAKDGSSAFS